VVKIVRVTRVDTLEVFPKYLRNGLEYSDQALHADRYYGVTGAGSQEFMTFGIDTAWKIGKVYGFLLSFRTVNFVIALFAAAERMKKFFCENLITKFQTVVEKTKVVL